ncbi:NADP-dependent oxidoreductase domain-containing protein [Collybia nuda]|uniref:NADP-dependent oxidoreductase domain-containing protein n=1 Tax=Collybia nuda TaxID=64659 RepID=A0A9P6CMD5_9AGAR|nr:NADP-dependent oxidoreductase domain-containing protein [Collybia nuda]
MSIWGPAPAPPTKLGRYRILSLNAGVRVSPLQLGAMSIGEKWSGMMGPMDKESSFKLLDAYYEAGGNFIDTANLYQDEQSEEWLGEWMEERGIRDQLFLATKYTNNFKRGDDRVTQKIMYVGNGTKSLHLSVEASLKKLQTSYIDLFYVHWWDYETSIEEVMRSLHTLVLARKVLYLGVSDTPAWVVAKANQYARDHGLTPFCIYQGMWNVMDRDFEREIIPMARSEGLALAPWGVLAGGKLRTDAEEEARAKSGEYRKMVPGFERTEKEKRVSRALEKVAGEVGTKHITAVAIAYLLHKVPYVFPLIGGRKVEHLLANVEALDISLSDEQMKELEAASELDLGFPGSLIGTGPEGGWMMASVGTVEKPLVLKPHTLVACA